MINMQKTREIILIKSKTVQKGKFKQISNKSEKTILIENVICIDLRLSQVGQYMVNVPEHLTSSPVSNGFVLSIL